MKIELITAALVATLLLFGCTKEVSIESQSWTYQKGICSVTVRLKNHSNDGIDRNVRIVAHKQKDIGDGAVVNDILGEKIMKVRLKPYEEKEPTETLALFPNRRPDLVVVNEYEAK